MRRSLPALVATFEEIYDQTGDAEAHGISTLLLKYLTVATIYMFSDVLHTVAKLQSSLQSEKLDLTSVPTMVTNTINRLKELKEKPDTSTWFKNHASVFSDQGQLGHKNIKVTEEEKTEFLCSTSRPYIQSVIDHTISRMGSTDLIGAASVFDPCHLPETEDNLSGYGTEKIAKLTDFYGMKQKVKCDGQEGESEPDIDIEETEAEWKLFRRQTVQRQFNSSSIV